MEDVKHSIGSLQAIRALGVSIAIDDFGTGFSSLSYLRSFPFNRIKIDRSFVADITGNSECKAIVSAVAALGISLGMSTTAEGVETSEQWDLVTKQGCTNVQGYYFSKPRPAAEIPEMLAEISERLWAARNPGRARRRIPVRASAS
jgi:EAL domain-containing protein (putative c-di-GMP-specific phosphodiesterase class I)